MKMIKYKYCRPTKEEYGHTKVYFDGKYVGYLISVDFYGPKEWKFIREPFSGNTPSFGTRKQVIWFIEKCYEGWKNGENSDSI